MHGNVMDDPMVAHAIWFSIMIIIVSISAFGVRKPLPFTQCWLLLCLSCVIYNALAVSNVGAARRSVGNAGFAICAVLGSMISTGWYASECFSTIFACLTKNYTPHNPSMLQTRKKNKILLIIIESFSILLVFFPRQCLKLSIESSVLGQACLRVQPFGQSTGLQTLINLQQFL
jgi:hypothetical protein